MKWEYHIVEIPNGILEEEFNDLGERGWELVSVVPVNKVKYIAGVRVDSSSMVYYFKRLVK